MTHTGRYPVGITAYTKGHCRCDGCRAAWRDYQREYMRERYHGHLRTVPVTECREHVRLLLASGMTRNSIARAAGCDHQLVLKIVAGEHKHVRVQTAEKLLGVQLTDRPDGCMSPAHEAVAMMDAMRDAGVPDLAIRDVLHVSAPSRLRRQQTVQHKTRRRLLMGLSMAVRQGIVPASALDEVAG